MRIPFLSLFLLFSSYVMSYDLDKRTLIALGFINQGYVQYGFEELRKIAGTNSVDAQFYVAVCYENGIGTDKNPLEAFKMYRRAAERGLPDAMYNIAAFYKSGTVVSQDASREAEWMNRFYQKGGTFILPDIISIYNEGIKHPENYASNPSKQSTEESGNIAQNQNRDKSNNQIINNITVVQHSSVTEVKLQPKNINQTVAREIKSDIDDNIPISKQKQNTFFAVIIANEKYNDLEKVPYASHDGEIFKQYCEKTLGIPLSNIRLVPDATLNNIKRQVSWLTQVMEAYNGEANVIFYYAGHGIPDESNRSSYLLPVDGVGNDVTTGYSLEKLYAELSSKPAKSVVVLLDACFSGAQRDGGMLASARGVAIKAKQEAPKGNMVVISAAQGDETAYPYKEKGHGMFTYYLLKKLQDSKGNCSLGELADYVTSEVKKQSVVINGKMQTPAAIASGGASNWKSWKLR